MGVFLLLKELQTKGSCHFIDSGAQEKEGVGVGVRLRRAKILRMSQSGEKCLQGQPLKMGLGRGA